MDDATEGRQCCELIEIEILAKITSLSHFGPTLQEGERRKEIAAEENSSKQ